MGFKTDEEKRRESGPFSVADAISRAIGAQGSVANSGGSPRGVCAGAIGYGPMAEGGFQGREWDRIYS